MAPQKGLIYYSKLQKEQILITYTNQNPWGPNQPSAAKMAPGMAGIPNEQTSNAQSLRPKVIFLFNTTIKNAVNEK